MRLNKDSSVAKLPLQASTEHKIEDIQVLRGISILLVLVCHASLTATLLAATPKKIELPFYLGVEIFFIISGYVITRSLIRDEFHAGRFVIRRLFRLLPAALTFLSLSFLIILTLRLLPFSDGFRAGLEANQFCVPWPSFFRQAGGVLFGYFILLQDTRSYYNGAMWSLSVEDQFYWTLAVVCLLMGGFLKRQPKSVAACILAISTLLLVSILAIRCGLLLGADVEGHVPAVLLYLTLYRFDFLATGILLAFGENRLRNWLRGASLETGCFLAPYFLVIPLAVVALCESPFASQQRWLNGAGMILTELSFACLVVLAANDLAFPGKRSRIYRLMTYLGDRSYTIYLFHFPVFVLAWLAIMLAAPRSLVAHPIGYGVLQIVVGAAILVPVCEVVYRYVEIPCMRLGKRIARRPGVPEAPPALHDALPAGDAIARPRTAA